VLIKLTPRKLNLLAGAASVTSIAPSSYHLRLPQFQRTDLQALSTDWVKVGNDLRTAIANETGKPYVEEPVLQTNMANPRRLWAPGALWRLGGFFSGVGSVEPVPGWQPASSLSQEVA